MNERTALATKKPERKTQASLSTKPNETLSQYIDSPIEQILHLQQTMGNQAVQKLFDNGTIQAKLTIGRSSDKYELEADRVADKVMRMPEPKRSSVNGHQPQGKPVTPLIQKQEEHEDEEERNQEEEQIQTQLLENRVMRLPEPPGPGSNEDEEEVDPNLEIQINSNATGQSFPTTTRTFFEKRFGHDFSSVRIHTDSQAANTARKFNAKAFTIGRDIYFGSGHYQPGQKQGKQLLAHELTHTLQQKPLQPYTTRSTFYPHALSADYQTVDFLTQTETKTLPETTEKIETQTTAPQIEQAQETLFEAIPGRETATETPPVKKTDGDTSPGVTTDAARVVEGPGPEQGPEIAEEEKTAAPGKPEMTSGVEKTTAELPGENLLTPFISSRTAMLEAEAENAAKQVVKGKDVKGSFTPSRLPIQFDLLSDIGSLIGKGASWVNENILQPIRQMVSTGWNVVSDLGRRISEAYQQAKSGSDDYWRPHYLLFRVIKNLRRNLYAEALEKERQHRQSEAPTGTGETSGREPSLLERADQLAEIFESSAESYFEVEKEIVEGAILGDFKENPTIWNTIGQIVVGFIPYAGQVADVRDLVASLKKIIYDGKYNDPWEWFNLILVIIGFIPGVGDIIKAVGRGAKGVIRRTLETLLRKGDGIWRAIPAVARSLFKTAQRFGKKLLDGAIQTGRRLFNHAQEIGRGIMESAGTAARTVRNLLGRLQENVGRIARSALESAHGVLTRGMAFLNRVGRTIAGALQRFLEPIRNLITRAEAFIRNTVEQGRKIVNLIRQKITDKIGEATEFLGRTIRGAIETGQRILREAKRRVPEIISRALRNGRKLAERAYKGAGDLIRGGMRWVKEKAIRWIKEKFQNVKQSLLKFLRDRWERLTLRIRKWELKRRIASGKQVHGEFPPTAGPGEVLYRSDPRTGDITFYQIYDRNGLPIKRLDIIGDTHGGIPTPHVHEYTRGRINPATGLPFVNKGPVRPALPEEIP